MTDGHSGIPALPAPRLESDFTVVSVLERLEEGLEVLQCRVPSYFTVSKSDKLSFYKTSMNVICPGSCGTASQAQSSPQFWSRGEKKHPTASKKEMILQEEEKNSIICAFVRFSFRYMVEDWCAEGNFYMF